MTMFFNDERDGALFRFWIRAASYPDGWPGRLSELLEEHRPKNESMRPEHYRAALLALAAEKRVNLP